MPQIDNDAVLELINRVRRAWGWRELAQLPKAVPGHHCMCVLGRAWDARLSAYGDVDTTDGYQVRFSTPTLTRKAAEALDWEYNDTFDYAAAPVENPLIQWMMRFDRSQIPELIACSLDEYEWGGRTLPDLVLR